MATTAIKVAIIKATIFSKSNNNNNNNNNTEFYQVKVNHLKLLLVATKKVSKISVQYQMQH